MARFEEAIDRNLMKAICMDCSSRNSLRAQRCRRCHSKALRPKNRERKSA